VNYNERTFATTAGENVKVWVWWGGSRGQVATPRVQASAGERLYAQEEVPRPYYHTMHGILT